MQPLPSVLEFNQLVGAIVKMKHYLPAISLIKLMEITRAMPSLYTLNIMINFSCRLNRVDYGFSILGKILKLGNEPDTITFNTLVKELFAEDKIMNAVDMVIEFTGKGCQTTIVTYAILVDGLCKTRNTNAAIGLLKKMEKGD